MLETLNNFLEKAAIFESLTDRERFVPFLDLLVCANGDEILKQGEIGSELYILIKGSIRIVATYNDYSEKVAIIADRGIIGEIAFATKFGKRTASVFAETDCVLLKLTRESFDRFRLEYPSTAVDFLLHLAESLGEKLARTTQALVSVERQLNVLGEDYGVGDFSAILKNIDDRLTEINSSENDCEGNFIAPPE